MDRGWMQLNDRCSDEYLEGIDSFIAFARSHCSETRRIRCPCRKCNNCNWGELEEVKNHLAWNGIVHNYTNWIHHGETIFSASTSSYPRTCGDQSSLDGRFDDDQVLDILTDVFPHASSDMDDQAPRLQPEESDQHYERLMKEAQRELYPGCKTFSVLGAVVELMHMKVQYNQTNKHFDHMMDIIIRMLPKDNCLPKDHYSSKKLLKGLGLGYVKIHACKNNCALFYGEFEKLDKCPVCNEPRYLKNKIPNKVLRYFPLKPRLQRFYMSTHTARDMRWHKDERIDNDILMHPADGEAWKDFDIRYPDFAAEPRNVRLGLATDGFNPFGGFAKPYSTWPVVMVPYNLPPWRCMKKEFTILSTLIPGPKSPSNSIDIYLRPLIDELLDLWKNGVRTYDKYSGEMFTLRAAVIWTINDFPAYGMLSGWSTKGYLACPICGPDTTSIWHASKVCYLGHRRWLPWDHRWRNEAEKFDGQTERRTRPREWSGDEILSKLNNIQEFVTRGPKPMEQENWTKKSIFFCLPYWSKLRIRHIADPMHIEKNVAESIMGTTLPIEGKSKDTKKTRLGMQQMGIRRNLWPKLVNGKYILGHPTYTFTPENKKKFLQWLQTVKFPDGYAGNISRNVGIDNNTLSGLKSHDYHVLLQRLIPIGVLPYLQHDVVETIVYLSRFFQKLCARTLRKMDVAAMNEDIVYLMCRLEQIYPPAFFDIMVHLLIHLPDEAKLAGPVHYRWMYPIERMLGRYKRYVRNKTRPEGSIAEAYIANESLTFCSMYLRNVETSFNRTPRNDDGGERAEKLSVFAQPARPFGIGPILQPFTNNDMKVAHWFILNNCDEVWPFHEKHEALMKSQYPSNWEEMDQQLFPSWFAHHMAQLRDDNSADFNKELMQLAIGPVRGETYAGCHINGVKFVCTDRDDKLSTQNSGVFVPGEGENADTGFFGKLLSVVQVLYTERKEVILFKCHWFDTNPSIPGRVIRDNLCVSVNTKTRWYESDPYILASTAKQVFYVDDPKVGAGWRVAEMVNQRNIWVMDDGDHEANEETDDDQQIVFQEDSSAFALNVDGVRTNDVVSPIAIDGIFIDLGDLEPIQSDYEEISSVHSSDDELEWEDDNESGTE